EGAAEQSGTDPRGVVHDITSLLVAIAGVARFKVVAVKTEDAALVGIPVEVKVGVGEQKAGNVFGGDVAGILGGADGRGGVGRDRREKQVDELIEINQHKSATGTIALEGVEVEARRNLHGPLLLKGYEEHGVPVGRHCAPELGSLNGVGDLRGCRAAGECRVLEQRRLERGQDERLGVVVQKHTSVWVEQIESYRDDGRVKMGGTAALRRIPYHVVEPGIPWFALRVKAGGPIGAIPVRQRIDSRSSAGIARIAVAMRRYSNKSWMSF